MVQDWVLRVTPLGLHLVQPRRWKRGELQLPLLRPLNCWQKPLSCWSLCVCQTWKWCDCQTCSLMLKWCCWTLVQHMAYVLQLQKKNGSRAQELRWCWLMVSLKASVWSLAPKFCFPILSFGLKIPLGSFQWDAWTSSTTSWCGRTTCAISTQKLAKRSMWNFTMDVPTLLMNLERSCWRCWNSIKFNKSWKRWPWSPSWQEVLPVLATTWALKWRCLSSSRRSCRLCLKIWRWSWSQISQCLRTPTSAWTFHGIAESEKDSWWQRMWSSTCTVDLMLLTGSGVCQMSTLRCCAWTWKLQHLQMLWMKQHLRFCFPCAPANVSKLYLVVLHAGQHVLSGFKKMMVHQFFEQKITHTVCHHWLHNKLNWSPMTQFCGSGWCWCTSSAKKCVQKNKLKLHFFVNSLKTQRNTARKRMWMSTSTFQCGELRNGKASKKPTMPSWSLLIKGRLDTQNESQPPWPWSTWMRWCSYKMCEVVELNLKLLRYQNSVWKKDVLCQKLGRLGHLVWGLQLLKQSADGSAEKHLHVKDLKILLALFTPMTMSDLLVSLQLEILPFNNGSNTTCRTTCRPVEIVATVYVLKVAVEHIAEFVILKASLWAWTCPVGWLVARTKLLVPTNTSWLEFTHTPSTKRGNHSCCALTKMKRKITLCLALMTLSSLVIPKNNNLEMVAHLKNMVNEINNKRAMKLNMNKVFLQELCKKNLILFKKNRFLTLWKMKKWSQPMECTTLGCASSMSPRTSLCATSLLQSPLQIEMCTTCCRRSPRSMLVCALWVAKCTGCTVTVHVNFWLDLSINGVLTEE